MPYQKLKTLIPGKLVPSLEKVYCFYKGFEDHFKTNPIHDKPIPPATLRYQVGSVDLSYFWEVGKKSISDIEKALQKSGKILSSLSPILDFGCGCGRSIIWLSQAPSSKITGVDVNSEAISWCKKSIHFADFRVCSPLPPLEFQKGTFALIYAISVFTHLDEEYQFAWLEELNRVLQPNGILMASIHGPSTWEHFPDTEIELIKKTGILYKSSRTLSTMFPKFYKNTYHTPEYIYKRWSSFFSIIDYLPKGINNHQDLVVLKKNG